jgi:23S rRNA C2498 (ribose-2'-O)-methylase RlmM
LNKAVGERRKKTLLCRQLYHDRKEVTCYFGPE